MNDNARWAAVVARDATADGTFVYCVKTTKIFCRPNCKARLARRSNVEFFDTPVEAQAAGYRSCKRCQPLLASYTPEADKIKKACTLLETLPRNAPLPGLECLAKEAGLTKHHFHRLFKRETGVTPREYAISTRRDKSEATDSTAMTPITPFTPSTDSIQTPSIVDEEYMEFRNVEEAMLEDFKEPACTDFSTFVIYYSITETTYGLLLVAFQNLQICKLELGTSEEELLASLEASFPTLYYLHSTVDLANHEEATGFQQQMLSVVEALENPSGKVLDMPIPIALPSTETVT